MASGWLRSAAAGCRLKGELGRLHSDAKCELASLADPMTCLEDLKPDALVKGLVGKEAVRLISVQRMGDMAR